MQLKKLRWVDPKGTERQWECASRSTRRGDVDGVAVFGRLRRKGHEDCVVLVSQFRPPLEKVCLELPAGIVDGAEKAEDAAVRELHEETGFSGRVVHLSPIFYADPGMSDANMQMVVIDIDGDADGNCAPKQHLDDGEFIRVHLVPLGSNPAGQGFYDRLLALQRELDCEVDARLCSMALAMSLFTPAFLSD